MTSVEAAGSAESEGGETPAPLHVAVLIPTLIGGGAERVALDLSMALAARGHRIDLVVMDARGELTTAEKRAVRLVDLRRPRHWTSLIPLVGYLRRHEPDVLLGFMPLANAYAGYAKALSGARRTLAIGSEHAYRTIMFGDFGLRRRLRAPLLRPGYRRLDAMVSVSIGIATRMAHSDLLPKDRQYLIYNPVRRIEPGERQERVDLPAWETTLLNVGRLDPQKDQATLLRAFAELPRTRDVGLVILGEGEERENLERLGRELSIEDRVAMPGWVPSLAPYFRDADLFVLSSDYEGFGLVIVEALSRGVPVVSTDCPAGPAEILCNGRYGRLVPVGDHEALARAMEAELASPRPESLLRERAEHFAVERAAEAYERCFGRLRERAGARTPR